MSSTPQQNKDNQEIDLAQISKKISQGFDNFLSQVFFGILFLKRNSIWLVALLIIGAGIGYYLDKATNVYNHKLIVAPNFGANDYLYAKVEQLSAKLKEDDTTFFKAIGINEVDELNKIQIEPIIDAYRFIDNKTENFDLIKLMAEDGNIQKILEDKVTSKNYPYHLISLTTSGPTTDRKTIEPILRFLNDSKYYSDLQKVVVQNIELKTKFNEQMLTQIDGILGEFSSSLDASALKSDRLVYFNNENSQLNDVLKTKEGIQYDQNELRIQKVSVDKIIKDISITLNIKNTKSVNGKLKFVLPFLFILGFIFIGAFFRFYKTQQQKLRNV